MALLDPGYGGRVALRDREVLEKGTFYFSQRVCCDRIPRCPEQHEHPSAECSVRGWTSAPFGERRTGFAWSMNPKAKPR